MTDLADPRDGGWERQPASRNWLAHNHTGRQVIAERDHRDRY